ncbi:MAG TPA: hypothetical protein VGF97_17840 [Rhizomicrobium sp.]
MNSVGVLQAIAFLVAATVLEVSGDAIALCGHAGVTPRPQRQAARRA